METERKKYKINNKEYYFKEKYSFIDWVEISKIIGSKKSEYDFNETTNLVIMLEKSDVNKLLNLIFTEPIDIDVYNGDIDLDDFNNIVNSVMDFLMRKKNSMINI